MKTLFYIQKAEWEKALREGENPRYYADGRFVLARSANTPGIANMLDELHKARCNVDELGGLSTEMVEATYAKVFNLGPQKPRKSIPFRPPVHQRFPRGRGQGEEVNPATLLNKEHIDHSLMWIYQESFIMIL